MKFTDEAKVGLFTLIGLGLLVVVISFLGIFSFTSNGYNLNVEFEQVKGLKNKTNLLVTDISKLVFI